LNKKLIQTVITEEGLKMAAKPHLRVVTPTTEKQTVAPDMARRRKNAELRSREHLTADEVERLTAAARPGAMGTATPQCSSSPTGMGCASRS
jgi:hypothetical protein